MATDRTLTVDDTFEIWLNKLNGFQTDTQTASTDLNKKIDDVNTNLSKEIDDNKAEFDTYRIEIAKTDFILLNTPTSLSVTFKGGKVRNGSTVTEIPQTTLVLPSNSNVVVGIEQPRDGSPKLVYYTLATAPTNLFIPTYTFVTGASIISSSKDLRTGYAFSSGTTNSTEGILQFDRQIAFNVTIPTSKNGLSVAPVVNSGITVTVEGDAQWVIL